MKRTKLSDRRLPDYSRGEEVMNMVTHIVGGAMGIAALTLCVIRAALRHNVYGIVTSAIYGFCLIRCLFSLNNYSFWRFCIIVPGLFGLFLHTDSRTGAQGKPVCPPPAGMGRRHGAVAVSPLPSAPRPIKASNYKDLA